MNERINQLISQATTTRFNEDGAGFRTFSKEKFAQLIVQDMCGLMEQAEDDIYHCFEPGEVSAEYIEWLRVWQEIFKKHFGDKE